MRLHTDPDRKIALLKDSTGRHPACPDAKYVGVLPRRRFFWRDHCGCIEIMII
jgi:hypothetical protein